jgi:hypothetical protein
MPLPPNTADSAAACALATHSVRVGFSSGCVQVECRLRAGQLGVCGERRGGGWGCQCKPACTRRGLDVSASRHLFGLISWLHPSVPLKGSMRGPSNPHAERPSAAPHTPRSPIPPLLTLCFFLHSSMKKETLADAAASASATA